MGCLIIDRGPCSGPSSSNRTDRQIRKRPLDAAGRTVDSRLQNQILRSTIGRDVEVDGHWSSLCVSPFGGSGRQLSSLQTGAADCPEQTSPLGPRNALAAQHVRRSGFVGRLIDGSPADRKSVAQGTSVSIRVELGGRRINKNNTHIQTNSRHSPNIT